MVCLKVKLTYVGYQLELNGILSSLCVKCAKWTSVDMQELAEQDGDGLWMM